MLTPPVYVITDPDSPHGVADQVLAAAWGGAGLIQIRDKHATDDEVAALVARLAPRVAALGARLIVNDRVEVALRSGAHGLHIGQGDGDAAAIRRRTPGLLLGLSVETLAQVAQIPPGIDYLGAGPIRATATKPDHAAPIGFAGLAAIVATAPCPVYAIGGLGPQDAAAVRATGACGLAVVSAVTRAPDPQAAAAALVAQWRAA